MRWTILFAALLVAACGRTPPPPERQIFLPCFDRVPEVQCFPRKDPEGAVKRTDDKGQTWLDVPHENLVRAWVGDAAPRLECREGVGVLRRAIQTCIDKARSE